MTSCTIEENQCRETGSLKFLSSITITPFCINTRTAFSLITFKVNISNLVCDLKQSFLGSV